ncbi:MAG: hypothetical protein KKE20_03965 [Nanoarchaeota archaeon]|nr:hypothetical protein [Nanoarchaeota archaeon]
MQPRKMLEDIARIVDTCSFGAIQPDDDSNFYTTQAVVGEITRLANSQNVKGTAGKALTAIQTIKDSSEVISSEAYKQIDSVVQSVYGDDEIVESPTVLGMKKSDFADSLSGLLYALGPEKLYDRINQNESTDEQPAQRVKSITIRCANSIKDKAQFIENVRQAILPAIEIGLFEELGITCRLYDKGDNVLTITDENAKDGENATYSLKGTHDFKTKFSKAFAIGSAEGSIGNVKGGEVGNQMKTLAYFATRPKRVLAADDSDTGQRMMKYAGIIEQYADLCSKKIVSDVIMQYDGHLNFDMLEMKAHSLFMRRLVKSGIGLDDDQERSIRSNISKTVAAVCAGRSLLGSQNYADISTVAAAYAVPENTVIVHSDDVDVEEMLTYARQDPRIPKKDVTVKTFQRSQSQYVNRRNASTACSLGNLI